MVGWNKKTALITGGCGHIGSFVVRKLIERKINKIIVFDNLSAYSFNQLEFYCGDFLNDDRITFIKGDVAVYEQVREAVKDADMVFHLAAYADVAATIHNPDEDFRTNVIGTYNVLKASKEEGIEKYIFASSAAIYGNQPWNNGKPPKFREDAKPNPLSTYANSKLWGEFQAKLFYELYGLKTVALRYFSVYGPLQVPKPKSHSWVVAIFLMRAVKGKPLIIYGGGQVRDFIYVEDVAEATVRASEANVTGTAINVGTGKPTTIDDLAQKIKTIINESLGIDVKIRYSSRPKGDPIGGYADTNKMIRLLRFKPRITLDNGIKKTLKWILKKQNIIPPYVLEQ